MHIGFVGVGRIGAAHADVVRRHPQTSTMVVADADAERASRVAERLECDSVPAVDELWSRDLDGVVIASATASHADLIIAAVEAGVPTFCEKPVALDVPGTLRAARVVQASGVPVQIGFQRRFDDGFRRAKQVLHSGELGVLHRLHSITADPAPPPAEYIPTSGGIFRDCLVHDFDAVRWVTGRDVVEAMALGSNRGDDFFRDAADVDNTTVLLRLDDDTLVTVHGSRYNGGGYDARLELAGTRATYAVGLDEHAPVRSCEEGVDFPTQAPWPTFWERFQPAYQAEIHAFVEMARGRRESPCTVAEALEALYVAEAAQRSLDEGRTVGLTEVRG